MTISTELRHAFNFHRAKAIGNIYPAEEALAAARADVAVKRARYDSSPWAKPCGNGARSVQGAQWIENPIAMGLRFVGYCDKVRESIEHTGWFTDTYQNETIRGVVYQLPGRDGKARYVTGHDNSDNGAADENGPAYIDWSTVYESDVVAEMNSALRQIGKSYQTPDMRRPGYWAEAAHETARKEAAGAADEFARIEAEKACEYDRAWQAGSQYAETIAERVETKADLRNLLSERRAAKAELAVQGIGVGVKGGALCIAIERQVRALIETMGTTADKAKELASGDYSGLSFWPGNKELRAAFNEGAGADILI